MGIHSILQKALAIFVAGMPGLQKLVVFILLEQALSGKKLGEFSSDYSIIQLLALLTTVGWCAILLSRIPKLDFLEKKVFLCQVLKSASIYSIVFLAILVILKLAGITYHTFDLMFFLLTWSFYQIVRHFALAEKDYIKISIVDTASTILLIVLVIIKISPFLSLGFSYFLSAILLMYGNVAITKNNLCFQDQKRSFEFGISNFLVSFGAMALPVLVVHTDGKELAGLVGYTLTITIIMQLITRSLGFYYIPEMAAAKSNKSKQSIYNNYKKTNSILTVFVFAALILVYFVAYKFSVVGIFDAEESLPIYTLLLLNSAVLSFCVPLQNYIIALEKSEQLFRNGLIYFGFVLIGYGMYYFLHSTISIYLVISYLILARFASYCLLKRNH